MSAQPALFPDLYTQTSPKAAPVEARREAREAIRPIVGDLHRQVLDALRVRPQTGEELEASTGLVGNTLRPRLIELLALGKVRRNGERRPTRSGRHAAVWEVAP